MVDLDHILWAAPDLDDGVRLFTALTGVAPARGGSHPGLGTRNFLASFGGGHYFEIISPDPAQSLENNRGGRIARLAHPGILTFALRTDDLTALTARAVAAGLAVDGPVHMNRTRPDGVRLDWSVLYFRHPVYGEAIPFAIDWGTSPHPSETTPRGLTLKRFTALHPAPVPLAALYAALGVAMDVRGALHPGFIAELATPQGDVILVGSGT